MNSHTVSKDDQKRVAIAVSCKDCDDLPRVDNAGATVEECGDTVQIMHNGLKTYCNSHYGYYNVEVIRQLRGVHEPQEERVFFEVLKQIPAGGKILELGSYWAYYSMWFLRNVPNGRAWLVEPVPHALKAGKRNFALNGCEGAFLHAAISAECKPVAEIELWKDFRVDAATLNVDFILEDNEIDFLDILHSDIQGTEARMLEGAKKSLAQKQIGWIFISTHSEYIHQVCLKILRGHGYAIIAEHTLCESYSVDGLIVASSVSRDKVRITKNRSIESAYRKFRSLFRVNVMEPMRWRERSI